MSLGYGPDGQTWRRHKVSGRTRAEVAEKLKQLQAEQDAGVQPEHAYTVQRAVDDWIADGLDGRSARTVTLYRNVLKPVTAVIGKIELRMLTAQDVRRTLVQLAAANSSSVSAAAFGSAGRWTVSWFHARDATYPYRRAAPGGGLVYRAVPGG